ncbi:unnamed protein product, partial [Durusdinium trenchii]
MDERSLSAQHVPPVPHHELAKPKSLASLGGHETRVGDRHLFWDDLGDLFYKPKIDRDLKFGKAAASASRPSRGSSCWAWHTQSHRAGSPARGFQHWLPGAWVFYSSPGRRRAQPRRRAHCPP